MFLQSMLAALLIDMDLKDYALSILLGSKFCVGSASCLSKAAGPRADKFAETISIDFTGCDGNPTAHPKNFDNEGCPPLHHHLLAEPRTGALRMENSRTLTTSTEESLESSANNQEV